VAVLPGTGLDAEGGSEGYVRVHFLAPREELSEAVHRLAAAWRAYHPQPDRVRPAPMMAV
jgi:aspartate/methionine/tyrosine aminotransferase